MKTACRLIAVTAWASVTVCQAQTWTLQNITRTAYSQEIFRLPGTVPAGDIAVSEDGRPIASVVDNRAGERSVYVATTIAPGQTRRYEIARGTPHRGAVQVKVEAREDGITLDNGLIAVRVPDRAANEAPCPISAVRREDGRAGQTWIGRGRWRTGLPLRRFSATVIDDGNVMGKVRLRYDFGGTPAEPNAAAPAFAEIDVTVWPGSPCAVIEERYAMSRGSAWSFEVTHGWKATGSIVTPHSAKGMDDTQRDPAKTGTLLPGQITYQDPALLLNLFPRWNQHCKDGWVCAAEGPGGAVGAIVLLAGRWLWPHDSSIRCLVKQSGDSLTLECPTVRGSRYWWLAAGPGQLFTNAKDLAVRRGYESLDTIINDIPIRDWPGTAGGAYRGYWPLSADINPTAGIRGWGKRALADADTTARSVEQLTQVQALLSPNTYGSYWLFWSPENPNFFTDFNQVPIGLTCSLREHPRFTELADAAMRKLREDIHHSIALPSGAGNECPGYQQYAMKHYAALAPLCARYLGEDPMQWPQLKAAARFIVRLSQPAGAGRRTSNPAGDTHPNPADPAELAAAFGVRVDVSTLETEELQNFGVIFRDRCGTGRESYLAFKSGPARGHYHGDQLAFHYCADARPLAVDHHCSYHPRAGQEHMHNRLAFYTDEMPYANMDGYERVIAFKTSPRISIAVGQVESMRLRQVGKLPPERWHQEFPQLQFAEPLKYRRTIVQVRGETNYFVIRDQFAADRDLHAAWCLHVLGDTCEQREHTFLFDNLAVFAAAPAAFEASRLDWEHDNGGREATRGLRLATKGRAGEFITVLHPGAKPPSFETVPGGVRIGGDVVRFDGGIDDNDATTYATVTAGDARLTLAGKDIDMDRSQGKVGLFVPDAGYPFGEIPDWLIRQRSGIPDWAPDWARRMRENAVR